MEGKATGLGGNGKENERRRRLLHTAEKKKEVEEVSKSLGPGPARRGSTSYIVRKKKKPEKNEKAVQNIMDQESQSKQTRKEKSSTQIAERANKSQRLCTGRSHSRCLPFYCVAV